MRTLNSLSTLALLTLLLCCCSGCIFTTAVMNAGLRTEALEVREVWVATNGAVALDCRATYRHPQFIDPAKAKTDRAQPRKFLVSNPEKFERFVSTALQQPNVQTAKQQGAIVLPNVAYASTDTWVLITPSYEGPSADPNQLPPEFLGSLEKYSPSQTRYQIDSRMLNLRFDAHLLDPKRKFRKWWGYPAQLALLPAVALDIVAWPWEYIEAMRHMPVICGNEQFQLNPRPCSMGIQTFRAAPALIVVPQISTGDLSLVGFAPSETPASPCRIQATRHPSCAL